MADLSPHDFDAELTDFLHAVMPFCASLGIRGISNSPDGTVMAMDWSSDRCTAGGVMHGGSIMALADSCGAALAFANLPEGAVATSTIESKTNFVGAVTEGTVVARSSLVHAGGQTIVVDTEVRQGDRLIAKTVQTQMVLRG